MPRLALAGNKTTTYECWRQLIHDGFQVDLLVTLTPEQGEKAQVAGYMDLRPFAASQQLPVYHPHTYSLQAAEDQQALLAEKVDCLLVIGWQRLIPEWWLTALSLGAFGMHGSPEPLPRGRGRSPLNWSLLQGKTTFMTHLFKYDPGVDSGAIVGRQKFDINLWDDCDTCHFKNRMAMNRLLKQHLPAILNGTAIYEPQSTEIQPTYFSKRTAEDGRITWDNQDMLSLYNHIRAQTRPFPGAFSYALVGGRPEKVYFWRGHPFDSHLIFYATLPGTIVEVFYDNSFLVAVWDGSVRIYDYTAPRGWQPIAGQRFINQPE
jgi:methionyl-tRNA formyltransferase